MLNVAIITDSVILQLLCRKESKKLFFCNIYDINKLKSINLKNIKKIKICWMLHSGFRLFVFHFFSSLQFSFFHHHREYIFVCAF